MKAVIVMSSTNNNSKRKSDRSTMPQSSASVRQSSTTSSRTTNPHLVTPSKASEDPDDESSTTTTKKKLLFGTWVSVPTVPPLVVRKMYRDNQRHTSRLGDSLPDDPMNGEFTQGSTHRLIQKMVECTELGSIVDSVFCDIGSGSGKIVMHAAACLPNMRAIGVEVSRIRYIVSLLCHKDSLERNEEYNDRILFKHADLLHMTSMGPLTHVYAASAA